MYYILLESMHHQQYQYAYYSRVVLECLYQLQTPFSAKDGRSFFMYVYFLCIYSSNETGFARTHTTWYPHIICIYFTSQYIYCQFFYLFLFISQFSVCRQDLFPGYTSQLLLVVVWSLRFSNRCCYPRTGTLQT